MVPSCIGRTRNREVLLKEAGRRWLFVCQEHVKKIVNSNLKLEVSVFIWP